MGVRYMIPQIRGVFCIAPIIYYEFEQSYTGVVSVLMSYNSLSYQVFSPQAHFMIGQILTHTPKVWRGNENSFNPYYGGCGSCKCKHTLCA